MIIYVGYILGDYAHAVFIGGNKNKVQKALDDCPTRNLKWIEEYIIDENELIELDCDWEEKKKWKR